MRDGAPGTPRGGPKGAQAIGANVTHETDGTALIGFSADNY
ncbi:hypothetical protein [Streptomyces sp. NBC_00096]